MTRFTWTTLPPEVRAAVESTLTVQVAESISVEHSTAELADVWELDGGAHVFVKGVRVPPGDNSYPAMQLAREARVLPELPSGAGPGLRFIIDVAGWRLLGTDYVHGERADLTADSPDVETVAHGLAAIAVNPRVAHSPVCTIPNLAYTLAAEEPWRRLYALNPAGMDEWTYAHLTVFANREPVAAGMCAGRALVHNAIEPGELVMIRGRWLCLLDWRHAQLGPAWTDLAAFAVLLVENGYDPHTAEDVVSRNSVWQNANAAAITAHAVQAYGMWELRRLVRPPHRLYEVKAAAWRAWAAYRFNDFRAKHRAE